MFVKTVGIHRQQVGIKDKFLRLAPRETDNRRTDLYLLMRVAMLYQRLKCVSCKIYIRVQQADIPALRCNSQASVEGPANPLAVFQENGVDIWVGLDKLTRSVQRGVINNGQRIGERKPGTLEKIKLFLEQ